MSAKFLIRTTTTVSRDFVVECENKEHAQKIANLLAYEERPADHDKTWKVLTVRDDVDVSSSVSTVTDETFRNASSDFVQHPDWLNK